MSEFTQMTNKNGVTQGSVLGSLYINIQILKIKFQIGSEMQIKKVV